MSQIEVRLLQRSDRDRYDAFLAKSDAFMPCASARYGDVLSRFMPKTCGVTFIALDNSGELVGSLPCRQLENERFGSVLNSLPFFGSIGGVHALNKDPEIYRALLEAADTYCLEHGVVSSTVIGSPLDEHANLYEEMPGPVVIDERIAMISHLPEKGDDLEGRLFSQYHESRRRNVRKAIRLGVTVEVNNTSNGMDFLERVHVDNISSIGGLTKPHAFFRAVEEVMKPGAEYQLYEGTLNGETVASLLLLYFNKTVEYFTPALVHEHRPTQALCLLIHQAMLDAARDGYRYWNWGGTWKTQTSLYSFKKKWGAQESVYNYYTKLYPGSEELIRLEPAELMEEYPYFFAFPFGAIDKKQGRTNG